MSDNAAILDQRPATSDQRPATSDQRPATSDQRPATSDQNYVLVSIIIPAYNTAPYIHRAIESSIRQTHSNVEIIIIDDGSNDDTLKISQAYAEKDSRIKVIHQENNGVASARNHGMREANGEYYVFLDSDDWLEDDAVEVLLDAQIKHPDKLIAANYFWVSPEKVKRIANEMSIQPCLLSIGEVAESFCNIWKRGFDMLSFHSACGKIFRADICRKELVFPDGITFGEDTIFVFNYINIIGGVFYINKPVSNYFERPDSASRAKDSERISKMLHSSIKIHESMMNHPKNTPEVKKLLIATCIYWFIVSSITSNSLSVSDKEAARKYLKNSAAYVLKCKKIFLRQKLSFIYKTYLPLCVSRTISYLCQFMKKIRDKIMRK